MEFELVLTFNKKRVADLLIEALEQGSGYWCRIEEHVAPDPHNLVAHVETSGKIYSHIDYPLSIGGALVLSDANASESGATKFVRLDWNVIKAGLISMAKNFPQHFGDWLAERDDAETGDVFLQCCFFDGKLVYG